MINRFRRGNYVDYTLCLKENFSQSGSGVMHVTDNQSSVTNSGGKSVIDNSFANSPGKLSTTTARGKKPAHPWEFNYKRPVRVETNTHFSVAEREDDDTKDIPYWKKACSKPKEDFAEVILNPKRKRGQAVTAMELLTEGYSAEEINKYFSRFEKKVIHGCRCCYDTISTQWNDLRREFRKLAESPKANSPSTSIEVTVPNYQAVMKKVDIKHSHRCNFAVAFRGKGWPEVVRVDEMYAMMKLLRRADLANGVPREFENDD